MCRLIASVEHVWCSKQKQGFWYARWASEGSRIRYHRLGDDPAKDALVFGDGLGPTEIPAARLSDNGRWLMIGVFVGSANDDTRYYLKKIGRAHV